MGSSSSAASASSVNHIFATGEPDGLSWDDVFPPLFGDDNSAFAIFGTGPHGGKPFSHRKVKAYGQASPPHPVGVVCKKGTKSLPNQDDLCYLTCNATGLGSVSGTLWLAGVFDGHGPAGEYFSEMSQKWAPLLILRDPDFPSDILQSMLNAFEKLDRMAEKVMTQRLHVGGNVSGTTCVIVVCLNNVLYVGWLGDSRAVVGFHEGLENQITFDVEDLTKDHKPSAVVEQAIIGKKGGNVSNNRVWFEARREELCGLGMSRSLGDSLAHEVGVSCIPDLKVFPIDTARLSRGGLVLLASDGIFEFIDNKTAFDIIAHALNESDSNCDWPSRLQHAAHVLATRAQRLWQQEGSSVDDITVLIVPLMPQET